MAERIYLQLLILCGILCQGIIATSDEDSKESSDLLVRKRRVINHLPGGLTPTLITEANYLVKIKYEERAICVGAILSHYSIITAASCFQENNLTMYAIHSGAGYDLRSKIHEATSKSVYYGNPPHQIYDGIALITVDPPFVYSRNTGYISLHVGPLPVGTLVTVRGWGSGCSVRSAPAGTRRRLRTITLRIMNPTECRNDYRYHYGITEKHICTYDQDQYCGRTDVGTPLVVNNTLAGIHVWKGQRGRLRSPDVYIDLHLPEYSSWVRANTLLM